jgi:Protein of unknown function (DUF3102)
MEVAKTEQSQVVRPLRMLVPLIKEDIRAAEAAGKPYRATAGAKLIEAKPQMAHGKWGSWLRQNFQLSERQAREWMSFARATLNIENGAQAPRSLHEHRMNRGERQTVYPQSWHTPIKEAIGKVNIDALKQDALAKQEERALQRKLALSLIDIGYKALASKLHPDKGGSREAMTRLNRVRDILRDAVSS